MKLSLNLFISLITISVGMTNTIHAATLNGFVDFTHRVDISLPVSGTVDILSVKSGQSIRKGEMLLRLNQRPFESAVIKATSLVTIRNADYQDAKRAFDHATELYDRGVLSTVELEKASLNEQRAAASKSSAVAHLDQEKYFLDNSVILAPYDGWVLKANLRLGESVNNTLSTQPMLSLAEANWYDAIFTLGLTSIKILKSKKTIKIKVAGKRFTGTISSASLEPSNSASGSKARYKIHIKFNSNGRLLHVGESASINLPN